ncbi:MAG: ABC transporter permease [Gammaproteobacteria bacterium]|nr:ABC transporter permease [Gammaproteobacteria bacterium]
MTKFLPLIWAALWRRRARTLFTLCSMIVAFLLYGVMQMIGNALAHPAGFFGADKLITTSRYSFAQTLPISQARQIAAVPGVVAVTWLTSFPAYYQDPRNYVNPQPVDIRSFLSVNAGEFIIAPGPLRAFETTRTGALVDAQLMRKYGWKIGQVIHVQSSYWIRNDGSGDWPLVIVGTFAVADPAQRKDYQSTLLFRYDYLDAARVFDEGRIGLFMERIDKPRDASAIAKQIDALFANSADETRTQPAKAFALSFIQQIVNVGLIVRAILGAVFFTLLFLTGNTLMQSFRERTAELAVLKTIGFSDAGVLALLFAEAALLCMSAAAVGLLLSWGFIPVLRTVTTGVRLSAWAVLPGLGIAAVLAFVVGLPPAIKGMRLSVADALAGR